MFLCKYIKAFSYSHVQGTLLLGVFVILNLEYALVKSPCCEVVPCISCVSLHKNYQPAPYRLFGPAKVEEAQDSKLQSCGNAAALEYPPSLPVHRLTSGKVNTY